MAISTLDDAMAREIIKKNKYTKFIENKKLMMAWLTHVPNQHQPEDVDNDEWIPFLFLVRNGCYNTMFDVAYDWLGHESFNKLVIPLVHEIHQHELLYMAKNDMIDRDLYTKRYHPIY